MVKVMIQWFPGHMAKAMRKIKEKEKLIDLFIVVLDARAPISSYNEEFDLIAPSKPRLFVVSKVDKADNLKINKVKKKFNYENDSVIFCNLTNNKFKKIILKEVKNLLKTKKQKDLKLGLFKPRLRVIVLGVPNSGKSTLINLLSSSNATKVANKPGITRGEQWVNINGIQLLDTPGILWPKFKEKSTGIKLIIIGSIKSDIIPLDELFNEGFKLISKYYPQKIEKLNLKPTQNETKIHSNLVKLCNNKNFVLKNNKPDLNKGMNWFNNYLKNIKGVTYD